MSGVADLLLRPWSEGDALGLRTAIDEDVAHLKPWLTWSLEEPASFERTRRRLVDHIAEHRSGRTERYAITPATDSALILGGANLYGPGGAAMRGVGYWVRGSAARRGIAGAAVAALVIAAFHDPGADRVLIQCDIANVASAAFARRLGFLLCRTVEGSFPDGTPRPLLEFDMTRHTYHDQHAIHLRERALRVRVASSGA